MDYLRFKESILKRTGIDLNFYKEKQMKRRINSLINRNNLSDYKDYLNLIDSSKIHFEEFINYLTINVSEFFRNKVQWDVVENKILPILMEKKETIKIWSAACSTGEEPYTIAMIISKYHNTNKVNILATDIDNNALVLAKKGIYNKKALKNVSSNYTNQFFIEKEKNTYEIKNDLKNLVTFKHLNLLVDKYPENCDLIICRNVLIYFTEEAKESIYKKFYESLNTNGVLFVGSTEQIIMSNKYGLKPIENFFYVKQN